MKYTTKIILNQNGKAIRCPVCDNEEVSPDGNYCHICGTCLINQCTNYDDAYNQGCGHIAAANARYCVYCGAPTTFLRDKILKPWNNFEEKNSFIGIPDELPYDTEEDVLPFL